MSNFAKNLKALRLKKGLTQEQLASLLNMSKSRISMYENGNREPSFETLEAIADFFNVDMNSLIGGGSSKETFAKNLQAYMDSKGIDRNGLSDAIGVPYTTVTDWLKGKTYPRIDKIEMMANYFGVQKSDLIEEYNDDIGYYVDKETADLANTLKENPGLRVLFDASKDMPPEDIIKTLDFINRNLKKYDD